MPSPTSSEERIKEAAIRVFMKKGMSGARMQDIANEAGTNKAMLHYYFKTKQHLFEIVYTEQFLKLFGSLSSIIFSDLLFEEKLPLLVKKEIEMFSKVPALPLFVLYEAWQNEEVIHKILEGKQIQLVRHSLQQSIDDAVSRKIIRPISGEQLLINIMSLVIYPLIAKPIISKVLDLNDKEFNQLIQRRVEEVTFFISQSLKPV